MYIYLLVHRHRPDYRGSPEAAAAWRAWFAGLGDALVDPGNGVLEDRTSVGNATSDLALGGYTLLQAESAQEAARLAAGCPVLKGGGAVEIGRLSPVPGRAHPARIF
jgi:hypothetical protein